MTKRRLVVVSGRDNKIKVLYDVGADPKAPPIYIKYSPGHYDAFFSKEENPKHGVEIPGEIVRVNKNGHCFFSCLVLYEIAESVEKMRVIVASYLDENCDHPSFK